ncbi:unnamed protein product [Heterosigma akashiwo]
MCHFQPLARDEDSQPLQLQRRTALSEHSRRRNAAAFLAGGRSLADKEDTLTQKKRVLGRSQDFSASFIKTSQEAVFFVPAGEENGCGRTLLVPGCSTSSHSCTFTFMLHH